MCKSTFSCCKIYISEARNKSALDTIERAVKLFPGVAIMNIFVDEIYNRVGYTLVSKSDSFDSSCLKSAVFSMVKTAFETIDLELHTGNHPRLGVVDHICFHPLASTSLEQVAETAKALAADIGSVLQVPIYTYGAAHKQQKSIDSIRRELSYFKPNTDGNQWSGGPQSTVLPFEPDEGPAQSDQSKGIIVIGATKWVGTYNIPVFCTNISTVRKIAKLVSGRGGGHASVQAIALVHGDVTEVVCNLLEPTKVGGDQVQGLVERFATEEGVSVGKGYFTDFSQDETIQNYLKLSSF
ncbi:formiminotransferase cyclodeaminase-like protein [Rutidosis leptorrhynchoides]|uniref:formiminotransferase cyclodeaminase-like protein n=1 Tax=Rutidosis leptorrhynchoides TaxID=125765 RepID=UPI003A99BA90